MDTQQTIRLPIVETDAPIISKEILIKPGMMVDQGQAIVIVETGGTELEIHSPFEGKVISLAINVGDSLNKDDAIASILAPLSPSNSTKRSDSADPNDRPQGVTGDHEQVDLVVIGGGPGGYTAAFRAADLGLKTVIVERHSALGGVCLNVGCIPSKALLHLAKIIDESMDAGQWGLKFEPPKLDIDGMRDWKKKIINQLNTGLAQLAKKRKVPVLKGSASFLSSNTIEIKDADSTRVLGFDQAIIATGSSPHRISAFPKDPRIVTSTGILQFKKIPQRFLIIGGGVVGMELATAFHAFGSEITVVESNHHLIASADEDLVVPLYKLAQSRLNKIHLNTKVASLKPSESGIRAEFEGNEPIEPAEFDMVLLATGRLPNSSRIGLDQVGVSVDDEGFVIVDDQQRTSVDHIYAIGDVTGNPMLAHKASYEGKIAAEVAAGLPASNSVTVIPFVAYTDPEIAWVGKTETELKSLQIPYEKTIFPWIASGRSLTMGRSEGKTKILFNPKTGEILGAGIVGPNASELIAQLGFSIETGCSAQDLTKTIYPHPTLSESLSMAAEIFEGTITDLYIPKSHSSVQN